MEFNLMSEWGRDGWLGEDLNGPRAARSITPPVDVIEDRDSYHFFFELPGLSKDSFDARVDANGLVVEAERKAPTLPEQVVVHRAERCYGKLRRAFEMPEDADPGQIKAAYKDGVLELTVCKKPEAKPVKIKVNYNN